MGEVKLRPQSSYSSGRCGSGRNSGSVGDLQAILFGCRFEIKQEEEEAERQEGPVRHEDVQLDRYSTAC